MGFVMAKITVMLDVREKSRIQGDKYPLVLRIGHKSTSCTIGFEHELRQDQYNQDSMTISGIQNAKTYSARVQKKYGDINLWLDVNRGIIKLWSINQLKSEIEKRFFDEQITLLFFNHAAKFLHQKYVAGDYPTVDTYHDSLKVFVKHQMKQARKDDQITIKSLFNISREEGFTVLPEYQRYDIPLKVLNASLVNDFKTYLDMRMKSYNSVAMHLRNLQSIVNNAGKFNDELKGHKPFEGIPKTSKANAQVVLTLDEIALIRQAQFIENSSAFHSRNYFLFMFDNMGMNFVDLAMLKVNQFDGERINYTRQKTKAEGDHFSIKQIPEALEILEFYTANKELTDYIFSIIPKDIPEERIHRVKDDRRNTFNKKIKKICHELGINKSVTSYTARDTWTNLGLEMG